MKTYPSERFESHYAMLAEAILVHGEQVINFVDYSHLRTELEDTSWTNESNESAGTPIGDESNGTSAGDGATSQ